jgi:SPP1 gp7 family putative phage head morphogenesis protein
VRDVLTTGLAEGVNPRELARRLTSEIRSLERTRAEVLARTEVINAHADATLDRYERAGTEGVTVSGEFATADDTRVCPICEAIEGEVFSPRAMRGETVVFEPSAGEPDHLAGEYPVKPPVHPNCRCAILPVV